MNKETRKIIATALSISLIFSQGVKNKEVRQLPPEKPRIQNQEDNDFEKKLKKLKNA